MKKIKGRFSIGKLFYNDKFVMIFSILLAFALWIAVATNSQETVIYTVSDIPINLPELSNDLEFFTDESITAEVKISGNALIVATVTNDDIYVTASDVSEITEPGTYSISLVPKKSGVKTDYVFESSVSPSKIDVYVDRYAEREFTITDAITVESVDDSYYVSSTVLSSQTVKISGAESVINSIAQVSAEYVVTETLSSSTTLSVPLVFYDSDGNVISSEYISADITTVDATIPVLKTKTVSIEPNIVNMPSSLEFDESRIILSTETIEIAGSDDVIDSIDSISTAEIDFSSINISDNTVTVALVIPSGCRNLNQIEEIEVTFDMTDMTSTSIMVTSFIVINESSDREVTVSTSSVKVTLIGTEEQIDSIASENLTGVINMESLSSSFTGSTEMPITISINSKFSSCWVYGSYNVDITVSEISDTSDSSEESSTESSE